jgi:hypothetical protein
MTKFSLKGEDVLAVGKYNTPLQKPLKIYHFKFDVVVIIIIFVFDGQDTGKRALVSSEQFFVSASNHQLE